MDFYYFVYKHPISINSIIVFFRDNISAAHEHVTHPGHRVMPGNSTKSSQETFPRGEHSWQDVQPRVSRDHYCLQWAELASKNRAKVGVTAHAYNPSMLSEAGGPLWVLGQPAIQNESKVPWTAQQNLVSKRQTHTHIYKHACARTYHTRWVGGGNSGRLGQVHRKKGKCRVGTGES